MKRGLMKNKYGDSQLYYTIAFLILSIAFFISIIYFVRNSSNGSLIYEETYSKQISLLIDDARPNTAISINFKGPLEAAKNNNFNENNIIKIDSKKGEITVKLSDRSGYKTNYFSNYKVETKFEGNNLILNIGEK